MVATYAWLSGGEIPSQRLRSYTFGIAASLGFLGAVGAQWFPILMRFVSDNSKWLATFTAPYFINPESLGWGPKYGYIWAPSCFLTVAWVYFFLPEVKNRTLEEIDEMVSLHCLRLHAHLLIVPCSLKCASQLANSGSMSAPVMSTLAVMAVSRRWRRLRMCSRMRRPLP